MTDSSHVKDKDGEPVATKTTVVYWKKDKKCNLVKTQWFVKEYMLLDNQLPKRNDDESSTCATWTLCVAYYDLKRRRESERGSGDVKCTSDDLHSLASDDKQNSDGSVKATCGNDDKCRSPGLHISNRHPAEFPSHTGTWKDFSFNSYHLVFFFFFQLNSVMVNK
ncbi:hypothetical protein OWV82_019284 [Melia azedarach]|uniref:Uncharacterized protein n=1 Tax=Melia azedarach TaxID=155640 RepID=A0ACC1XFN9_MELAZ|nr:hypothetical protein OWV82_019284 [Melia azedarach]